MRRSSPKIPPLIAWPIALFLPGVFLAVIVAGQVNPAATPYFIICYALLHYAVAVILRRKALSNRSELDGTTGRMSDKQDSK